MPNVFMADDLTGWVYLYDNTTNREKEATMCILIPQVYSCKGDHTYCISDINLCPYTLIKFLNMNEWNN